MEKDRKRVRTSRELKELKDRPFDELVAHAGSIARGYEWLSKTIVGKFVQSFTKEKDPCYEDTEEDTEKEEEEEDIVEEEKSRNELQAKRKEMKNKNKSEDKNTKGSLTNKQVVELYPKLELPVEFRKRIQELKGCDVVLVMDKLLTKTDVDTGQGRLSIPPGQIRNEFLTEEEHKDVNEKEKRIEVKLIEPCLAVSRLYFKMWRMTSSSIYVLLSSWQNVTQNPNNGLVVIKGKKTVRVQLWAFRAGSKRRLCFALVNVGPVRLGDKARNEDHGTTTSSRGNGGDGTSSSQPNGDLQSQQ